MQPEQDRTEFARDALVMVVNVSILLIGVLVALPDEELDGELGPHGWSLAGLIWGTTLGIALAHVFAYDIVARGLAGGRRRRVDLERALAAVMGAVTVATVTSLPLILVDDRSDQEAAIWVPTIILGLGGFAVARISGRSRLRSVGTAVFLAIVGTVVAIIATVLSGN